jgi:hypothetical protein
MTLKEAVEAYARDELSAGQAATAAGITKVEFLRRLGEFGVSVLATDRLEEDAETAHRMRTSCSHGRPGGHLCPHCSDVPR